MVAKTTIQCQVNGQKQEFQAYPMARLLDVLREQLQLTGTKEGCGEGECGACTVFINGQIVNSCLVPALQAQDADIQTIEGIAQGEQLTAVQQCFVEHGGAQCGICTPGMVLAAVQYMRDCENQAQPINDPDLRHALSGNLCRCTGYMKIFESVLEACKQEGLAV